MSKLTEDDIYPLFTAEEGFAYTEQLNKDINVQERYDKWITEHGDALDKIFTKQSIDGTGMGIQYGIGKWKKFMFSNYELNQIKKQIANDELKAMVK